MSDTTYAVKLPEEVQERIKQLVADSGTSNKDFITNLITQFELEQTKVHTPIISQDITEIQQLTKRIDSIFIGIGERIGTLQADYNRDIEKCTSSSKDTIQLLQQRINTLEQDKLIYEERIQSFISDKEQAELKSHKLSQQIEQLDEINLKNNTIIQEYKRKIDDLSSIVSEYKVAYENNKELQQQITTLQQDNNTKAQQIITLAASIEDINATHDKINNEHIAELEALKENITDKLSIANEKALLKVEKEYRTKLDEQQNRHNEKLNQYEDKVQQLLKDIEIMNGNKKSTTKTVKPS